MLNNMQRNSFQVEIDEFIEDFIENREKERDFSVLIVIMWRPLIAYKMSNSLYNLFFFIYLEEVVLHIVNIFN